MPPLVESVSPIRTLRGIVFGLLALLVAWSGYAVGATLPAAALVLLALVFAVSGLDPLGVTPGYRMVLAAVLGLCGFSLVAAEGVDLVSVALVALGVVLLVQSAHQARSGSVWEPAG